MIINKGVKQIKTAKDKKPLVLAITDRRKIIITKNKKKTKDGNDNTYYSYQLNIPKDFLRLIQDDDEYGDPKKGNYKMHLLELHKQHYMIKLAPLGITNILTLRNEFGEFGNNTFNKFIKKSKITKEEAYKIIDIIENEQIRNTATIAEKINKELNIDKEKAYEIYEHYRQAELKDKRNRQLTLPKKNMVYLQSYDKLVTTINKVNENIEQSNKNPNNEKQELFKIPQLYTDMYFFQIFNIEYLHFEYELHFSIKTDIDKRFIEYVKNDPSNPGGIPGWLETLIIDWNDIRVQKLLGITAVEKDYDLHKIALDKPLLNLDDIFADDEQADVNQETLQ